MAPLKLASSKQIWRELTALIIALVALFMLISLISYYPSDNSWLNSSSEHIYHNWGGYLGANLADTLFLVFGFVAYLVPPILFLWCGAGIVQARGQIEIHSIRLVCRICGATLFFLSCCALAEQSVLHSDYFNSGGIIGADIQQLLTPLFGFVGRTLLLIAIWLLSLTLALHVSWLSFCERVGYLFFVFAKKIVSLFKRQPKKKNMH